MSAKNGKKKWIIIIMAVVLVAAVAAGAAVSGLSKEQEVTSNGSVELVTKRTIANSISGNGTIEASNMENVTGGFFGMKVEAVNVAVGDMVAAGDVICTFNTENIDEQIKNMQENIADTKEDKRTHLADYDQQIADAEEANAEQLAAAEENLAEAQADLAEAQASLAQKQAEYDAYLAEEGHSDADMEAVQMEIIIESKKSNVETIQVRADAYQSRIDSLEQQDTTTLKNAKENYAEQMDNTISNLEEQLETLQEQKAEATVYAGISGTVTAVNVSAGSSFSGGTIACIEGADQFIVEAQIEEYDIADVAVGMKVLVKTDATRDEELEGVITYVAPRATNSGGSSTGSLSSLMGMDAGSFTSGSGTATYLVKIELKEQNDRLRLGMNAKTSIITQESTDVWSVPYDAVYTRDDGTTYLEQVTGKDEEGSILTKELDVQVGLQGTYYVEVISDQIADNTEILVPDAQGNSSIEELLNIMGADAGI